MNQTYIFFDLDGVISDPQEGITKAIDYALRQFQITTDHLEEYSRFIGPPLYQSLQAAYGFDDEKTKLAVENYRVYFRQKGIFENYMYPGIDLLIENLYQAGKKIILATSKPTEFSCNIIRRYGLYHYFFDVCGSTLDNTRTNKGDVIAYAIQKNHIQTIENCIMVGDRKYDIEGARQNHMDCIAVTYGYGSIKEIEESHPLYIVSSPEKLQHLLLSENN